MRPWLKRHHVVDDGRGSVPLADLAVQLLEGRRPLGGGRHGQPSTTLTPLPGTWDSRSSSCS
jgi:hypothetical protein